ncbi:hypothetical protein Pmar_PMAR001534 [Perkinsus marinus ATCC 50983]|uniref:Uncharacterized protein n=1 Tax=Perkinsus marinus (strain ATCC 50983 / TXsc) TaxID=423536 RepID=C5L3E6_PERM5|nr:hypothetical protein Pmar_PMAR001534 [Perkinsus marinus ATCC 50983]EER08747.1 hypothetical protein Pmar_PMAR001534 [Perkinsus marinus ATCC 50983]|eukprot:XP_002776931.1 hypothetical protein Pmar_PMAR001534 [Perkinsus marinus ATCC 50983]
MNAFSFAKILFVIGVTFAAPVINPPTTPTPTTVDTTDDGVIIEPVNPAERDCANCVWCRRVGNMFDHAECWRSLFVCGTSCDSCCEGF